MSAPEIETLFSRLAAPARRALKPLNLVSLTHLAGFGEETIAKLHGIGPGALKTIRETLQNAGLEFSQPWPSDSWKDPNGE